MSEQISVFINPLTDFAFKYLFGRTADKGFMLSLLNSIIESDSPITDLTFVDKEKKGESKDDRALIYDLHCELANGNKIIVEMQNRYQPHFDDRAIYYLAADLYAQGEKGESWDYKLTPVYGVFMMNFRWKAVEEQHLREDVCLYNMHTQRVFSDKMRMTFLKIPMLDKEPEDCKTTLERWIYILKNLEKMEAIPQSFMTDPIFRRLGKVARFAALNKEEQKAYKASLKAYRDSYAIMKNERDEGRVEGIEIGREQERENGIRIAFSFGASPEAIAEKYGVSIDMVKRILNL